MGERILPNPDCVAGKHGICDGGWDADLDEPCPCPCACHDAAMPSAPVEDETVALADSRGRLEATVDVEGVLVHGMMVGPRCESRHPGTQAQCVLTRFHRAEHTTEAVADA